MLSDRHYMRNVSAHPPRPSFTLWLLGVLAGIFVLQSILGTWFQNDQLQQFGYLSARNIRAGRLWTPLTYALLHGYLLHLVVNALGLYLIGKRLEEHFSAARLSVLAIVSALGGGLFWLLLHYKHVGSVTGSSAVLTGFITVFVCLDPRDRLALIPVPRYWLLVFIVGLDLAGLLLRELPQGLAATHISHSAHIGGALGGALFYFVARMLRHGRRSRASVEPPAWARRQTHRREPACTVNLRPDTPRTAATPAPAATSAAPRPRPSSREALRVETDRILDKIHLHGLGSLTPAEKRTLDEAGQHLNPR